MSKFSVKIVSAELDPLLREPLMISSNTKQFFLYWMSYFNVPLSKFNLAFKNMYFGGVNKHYKSLLIIEYFLVPAWHVKQSTHKSLSTRTWYLRRVCLQSSHLMWQFIKFYFKLSVLELLLSNTQTQYYSKQIIFKESHFFKILLF